MFRQSGFGVLDLGIQQERLLPTSIFDNLYIHFCGPGSSVVIATDYGLEGPGSNPGGDEIFRPSRPALGST